MASIFLKAQNSGWYPAFLQPVVNAVSESRGADKILDIGTGPGKLPELLITHNPGLKITGIDTDANMIEEARKRLSHENVRFRYQEPGLPLDFNNNAFDIVMFCSVLFLLSENTKSLLMREALRVLKPGGKIIILTPTGKKSIAGAFTEVWRFPYSKNNWTFMVWRLLTSTQGKHWQKQKWSAQYANEHQYQFSYVFNNNATLEIITKSNTIKN
ncbi:MAG: class I SAM-dependent methyltransferase [Sphingobacteriales bacterium]